jgi:membrane protease YdiL (CAAX protease family)
MPQPPVDPVLFAFQASTLLASIIIGVYLLYAGTRGPILAYVPRRPVPWGPIAAALVVLYVLTAIGSAVTPHIPEENTSELRTDDAGKPSLNGDDSWSMVENLAASAIVQMFIVSGFAITIAIFYKATARDLGLPENSNDLRRDILVGAVACLAALAPVHIVQILLRFFLNMQQGESGHPLVEMIKESRHSGMVMILAAFTAVVVAPFVEEIAFRLLLQGWLEKWEDEHLGWRGNVRPTGAADNEAAALDTITRTNETVASDPPPLSVGGLPHGWPPILASSLLFGMAHIGYGPEPVPLFLLGLFLGYVYQRTHRLAPGIVCHALFNFFTVFQLWRLVFHSEQ